MERVSRSVQRLLESKGEDLLVDGLPYALLIGLIAWYGVLVPASFTGGQFTDALSESLVLMFAAAGQTVVLLSGGIDLSVGGVMSISNTIGAAYMGTPARALWVTIALIAFGWVPGAINGALITVFRLQPFIVTLGTWFVFDGIAFFILPTAGGSVTPGFYSVTSGSTLGINNAVLIVAALVLAGIWFLRTRIGLEIRSIGSDRRAAEISGVRTGRSALITYGVSSFCAVLAGIVLSSQNLSGDPTVGDKYLLSSIAAAVIGGTSLFGGAATVVGTLVGALVLAYLARLIFALGFQSEWGLVTSGLLLALAVAAQGLVRRVIRRKAIPL